MFLASAVMINDLPFKADRETRHLALLGFSLFNQRSFFSDSSKEEDVKEICLLHRCIIRLYTRYVYKANADHMWKNDNVGTSDIANKDL